MVTFPTTTSAKVKKICKFVILFASNSRENEVFMLLHYEMW